MSAPAKKFPKTDVSPFHELLQQQVRNEFTAAQQYIAVAVWFDNNDLPQLAKHFYGQSKEEHNHAMMIVQYLMDRDIPVAIPGVDEVRNEFADAKELIALALEQEREVTDEIITLARTARDNDDYMGEQFMQWFLAEQVEEVSQMSTLLNVVERADGNLFHVEDFLHRESVGDDGSDNAPKVAGGAL